MRGGLLDACWWGNHHVLVHYQYDYGMLEMVRQLVLIRGGMEEEEPTADLHPSGSVDAL